MFKKIKTIKPAIPVKPFVRSVPPESNIRGTPANAFKTPWKIEGIITDFDFKVRKTIIGVIKI